MNEFIRPNITEIDYWEPTFQAGISENALRVAHSLRKKRNEPDIAKFLHDTTVYLRFAAEIIHEGGRLFIAREGSRIGTDIVSNVLESARSSTPVWDYEKANEGIVQSLINKDVGFVNFCFGGKTADNLFGIEDVTGIESFEVLVNHSMVYYKAIVEDLRSGQFVVALNTNNGSIYCFKDDHDDNLTHETVVQTLLTIEDYNRIVLPDRF